MLAQLKREIKYGVGAKIRCWLLSHDWRLDDYWDEGMFNHMCARCEKSAYFESQQDDPGPGYKRWYEGM